MKLSHLIFLGVFIFSTWTVSAQEVNFGIKGGLNLFNLNSSDDITYESKPSFHIGLLGHIHINQQYAIQPELVYSSQKSAFGNSELVLDYLNIPLLFQYMFDNGFRFEVGPQLGLLTRAKINGQDADDSFKGTDLSLSLGMGYIHPPSGFGLDVRYNHGLSDISTGNSDVYNRGVQLGVFYQFDHHE